MNILSIAFIAYIIPTINPTSVPKVDTTNSENHISEQDPKTLNLMVSHYDCAKQNISRQFSLIKVEPCKRAPSDIQHTRTQATVYGRAKAKKIKAFKCEAYVKTEKVWCSTIAIYKVHSIAIYKVHSHFLMIVITKIKSNSFKNHLK